jgi:signal transduction histidine kinase
MNYIVKIVIFLYLIFELILVKNISYDQVFILLVFVAINILKERLIDSVYLTITALLLTCVAISIDDKFAVLFTLIFYDFILKRFYIGIVLSLVALFYSLWGEPQLPLTIVLVILCSLLAFVTWKGKQEGSRFNQTLDNERRLRYELEQTKVKLLHSSKEIANIAEVKERNRIARDIHDSVGHSMAGILIQLQAAYKLHSKDMEKSMIIVKNSIDGLANSVELLRNTVHNIKPKENLGIEYIKSIIDNFKFCAVNLKTTGDFNVIPASHLEILSTNIKEALTNSARYSQATKLEITIDVNDQFTRLFMRDNGVGCKSIKEGLGLSGMKERVRNIGGSISISANEGFLIVCLIPRQEGSGVFESTYRR